MTSSQRLWHPFSWSSSARESRIEEPTARRSALVRPLASCLVSASGAQAHKERAVPSYGIRCAPYSSWRRIQTWKSSPSLRPAGTRSRTA